MVLTLCGADVGLMNGAWIIVHWAYPHSPLVALNLGQPVRELHLLGILHLHSMPYEIKIRRKVKSMLNLSPALYISRKVQLENASFSLSLPV